jgi:hypothetical protein
VKYHQNAGKFQLLKEENSGNTEEKNREKT